ncbi:MAG: SPOR domain-containing protein [Gammaproteobacteria bacterium]|nr:SPOR domain-containing protein [Gammaproteobacteria bacterium]
MSDTTSMKHRILGTLVLVSLAVIFLPMLFSNNEDIPGEGEFIPSPPDKLKTIIYRLDDEGVFKLNGQPDTTGEPGAIVREVESDPATSTNPPVVAAPVETTAALTKEATTAQPLETAEDSGNATPNLPDGLKRWVAQVGSFSQEANATQLRDKIRGLGYSAYVDKREANGKTIWRVKVGPYVVEQEAQTAMQTLQKKLGVNGIVMRHQ